MPSAEVSAHSTTSTVARRLPTARHDEVGDASMVAESLSLGFAGTTVLEDVTLEVPRNRITALVGPSGSGKTTFLRSLNRMNDKVRGFEMTGRVLLDGCDIYGRKVDPLVVRRKVGMVFQRPNPFPMSIRDNVVAGARVHKLATRHQWGDIAETYLAEVGLWAAVADRLGDSPYRLSGGQQQLLCLARALAVSPEVLLLDEPTSSLDPMSTEAVEELLVRLKSRVSLVIVTHNLTQARRVADRVAFFHQGQLVEVGPTASLFESPRRGETAHYVSGQFG
ncbi:MAG TPA: phosphate ABC transporter ATP-binding protein [Acidimicrobiales bacterium]|nr:phosphate ABC transporter ATP-binding protein [Acidimicrobiales bacterium]